MKARKKYYFDLGNVLVVTTFLLSDNAKRIRCKIFILILLVTCHLSASSQNINQLNINDMGSINWERIVQLVNDYRKKGYDCGSEGYFDPATPVRWNDTLALAAKEHSKDMYTNNFFSHTGSDLSSMGVRIRRQGYSWTICGENIGKGYRTEEQVITGWMNSPGHCSNIMNPKFKEIGVAKMGDYWTLVLGAR